MLSSAYDATCSNQQLRKLANVYENNVNFRITVGSSKDWTATWYTLYWELTVPFDDILSLKKSCAAIWPFSRLSLQCMQEVDIVFAPADVSALCSNGYIVLKPWSGLTFGDASSAVTNSLWIRFIGIRWWLDRKLLIPEKNKVFSLSSTWCIKWND